MRIRVTDILQLLSAGASYEEILEDYPDLEKADVLAALKDIKFQGVAYAAPEAFDAKGDNTAAVIFVNDVDGDRFREIDQIGGR